MPSRHDFQALHGLFVKALALSDPAAATRCLLAVHDEQLLVGNQAFPLNKARLWVFGFGKAAATMAQGCYQALGEHIYGGLVICPESGRLDTGNILQGKGNHPIPDEDSLASTQHLLELMAQVQPEDLVLFLISGGSSALLCKPEAGITMDFKQELFRRLLRSGADIYAMNTVRKHVSVVKGGKLLRRIPGTRVVNLIISDVPGDDAATIGSGPTTPDPSTLNDAKAVIEHYLPSTSTQDDFHGRIQDLLNKMPHLPESPKPGEAGLPELHTHWVLTPHAFAQTMADLALQTGLAKQTWVDPESFSGSVEHLAAYMSQRALEEVGKGADSLLLCFHGETEVHVKGDGRGGRNQHLALHFALREMPRLSEVFEVTLMCVGTDGVDGNSEAAGVVVDQHTIRDLRQQGLDPEKALSNFDSNTLFNHSPGLIHTGPTGNNVMDAAVLLIRHKPNE